MTNVDADTDPSKANRRYNPYDGMDPSDPNYVGIPPEEFREMMRKKKAMGIPSLKVLKEKTEECNLKLPDAAGSVSVRNTEKETTTTVATGSNNSNNKSNNKTVNIEKEEEENIPPPPIPPKWKKFLRMQNVGVQDEAILQLARAHGKTPTRDDIAELRGLLGMEVTKVDENDDEGAASSVPATVSASATVSSSGQPPRPSPKHFQKFLAMKNKGIPRKAVLQSARLQGHTTVPNSNGGSTIMLLLPRFPPERLRHHHPLRDS
jgi:hypothetical protein